MAVKNSDIKAQISKLHGIGVFAGKDFSLNDLIEICPLIVLPKSDVKYIDRTKLYNYYFSLKSGKIGIALGLGSIYNHSYRPNAVYEKNFGNNTITIKAIKLIKKSEEITVNYNGKPQSKKKVWFEK